MGARAVLATDNAPNAGVRATRALLRTRTLAQIARQLGCTRASVHGWAHGTHTPSPEWRERLAQIWNVPPEAWEKP